MTARLGSARVSQDVENGAGESTDVRFEPATFTALRLKNPDLWWPNGHGAPTLHDLTVTTVVGHQESDARTLRVGLRQYDYASENPVEFEPGSNRFEQGVEPGAQQARWVRIRTGRRATGYGASLWRLSVTDSAAPGSDLALQAAATASSTDNASNTAAAAVDGDDTTRRRPHVGGCAGRRQPAAPAADQCQRRTRHVPRRQLGLGRTAAPHG